VPTIQPPITPFIWFETEALPAAEFYTGLFPGSAIQHVARMPAGGPGEEGAVLTVSYNLAGMDFIAMNNPRQEPLTNAISFMISVETQAELDHYYDAFLEGGNELACGWVTDRFGMTWQVTPKILGQLLGGEDRAAASRTMQAMMGMRRLIIADLLAAAEGAAV
jgi:predicted 3-demethylubiquinone-9 3-methyltransferase (glyoxalase superfamily)